MTTGNHMIDEDDGSSPFSPKSPSKEESVEYITCPECEGDMPARSNCCYAPIDADILICRECKEHAELAVCETCNGKGVVEKTEFNS